MVFKKKNNRSNSRDRNVRGVNEDGSQKVSAKQTYNKFGSKAQMYEDIQFDSELELRTYKLLKGYVESGFIKEVLPHPPALLLLDTHWVDDKFKVQKNKSRKKIPLWQKLEYRPDFLITLCDGSKHYIDTKSIATITDSFVIKAKLVQSVHNTTLVIITREMLDYLPKVFKDLSLGRAINPITKVQLNKILERYKSGE